MPLDPADEGRLRDMVDFGREAIQLLGDLDVEAFTADRRTFLAVSRCIEVVGEAGWKLSNEVKRIDPAVPWTLIAGMRHRLIHDYGRVDVAVVHRVVVEYLPPLIRQVEAILAQGKPAS